MNNIYDSNTLSDKVFHVSRTVTEHMMVPDKDVIEIAIRDMRKELADFLVRNPKLASVRMVEMTDLFGVKMARVDMSVLVMTRENLRDMLQEAFAKGVRHGPSLPKFM